MIKNKKIYITGGAGFIANTIIKKLIDNNKIIAYDNFFRDTISSTELASHPNLQIIRGDVLDYPKLVETMQGADIVVHCAAIAGIDTVIKKPTETMRVNLIGTANVLEAARENRVSDRFLDFSTSEVFGSKSFKSSEDDDMITGSAGEARWSYCVSKLAAEHLTVAYHKEYNIPSVIVRPFNVYGPGQTGDSAILRFISRALKNEDITIFGDGTQIRAWCYIDDFVEGIMKCLEIPDAIGHSFNIGNERTVLTIYGLAQTVCRVLDSESKITFKPALSADIELRVPAVQKAKDLLDFQAVVELEDGILRTAEWLKTRLD
jgi:UDP-glucose 4-epimerase